MRRPWNQADLRRAVPIAVPIETPVPIPFAGLSGFLCPWFTKDPVDSPSPSLLLSRAVSGSDGRSAAHGFFEAWSVAASPAGRPSIAGTGDQRRRWTALLDSQARSEVSADSVSVQARSIALWRSTPPRQQIRDPLRSVRATARARARLTPG